MLDTDSQCLITYDRVLSPSPEFLDILEKLIPPQVRVTRAEAQEPALHSPFALEWIELAFIFVSSTVASGILTKIGEEVWDSIKAKITNASRQERNPQERRRPISLSIRVDAGDLMFSGQVVDDNYEDLLEAVIKLHQMLEDAQEKGVLELHELREQIPIHTMRSPLGTTPPSRPGLQLDYQYDSQTQEWAIKSATLLDR